MRILNPSRNHAVIAQCDWPWAWAAGLSVDWLLAPCPDFARDGWYACAFMCTANVADAFFMAQNMKNFIQQGFTFIELMVTIAIIGVLTAVAWPVYQDYVGKTYAAAAHAELLPLKDGISIALAQGQLTGAVYAYSATELSAFGAAYDSTNATRLISVVGSMDAGGMFIIQSTLNGPRSVNCKVFQLKRTSDQTSAPGEWSCSTNMDAKYAPPGCVSDSNLTLLGETAGC